jgi:hypothetical protein
MFYFIDLPQLMSYQDSLRPWVIYQLLPNCQRLTVDRFRHRSEADNYLQVLQRLQPQAEYAIVFEMEVLSPQ